MRVEAEWGRAIPTRAARRGGRATRSPRCSSSTARRRPASRSRSTALAEACAQHGALLFIDCVTSLAGHPLDLDDAGVDAAFSGSQKCLNCPPGLAPFTANDRALERLQGSPSWYFDLQAVLNYWQADGGRAYHHTAPTNMVVALREALEIVQEEGLEARWARHATAHEALRRRAGAARLRAASRPDGEQLHPLLAVRLPDGVDDAATRGALLQDHGIEVAAASGPFAGQAWRIGVMGEGARQPAQERLVRAIARELETDADGRAGRAARWLGLIRARSPPCCAATASTSSESEQVLVRSTTLAAPLLLELQGEILRRGAWPLLRVEVPGEASSFYANARDEQLDDFAPLALTEAKKANKVLSIQATGRPARAGGDRPGPHGARRPRPQADPRGDAQAAWCTTLWPTPALAAEAGMSEDEYGAFVRARAVPRPARPDAVLGRAARASRTT